MSSGQQSTSSFLAASTFLQQRRARANAVAEAEAGAGGGQHALRPKSPLPQQPRAVAPRPPQLRARVLAHGRLQRSLRRQRLLRPAQCQRAAARTRPRRQRQRWQRRRTRHPLRALLAARVGAAARPHVPARGCARAPGRTRVRSSSARKIEQCAEFVGSAHSMCAARVARRTSARTALAVHPAHGRA